MKKALLPVELGAKARPGAEHSRVPAGTSDFAVRAPRSEAAVRECAVVTSVSVAQPTTTTVWPRLDEVHTVLP